MFTRFLGPSLEKSFSKPFVHILFGARQTGKSSLVRQLIPEPTLGYDFSNPAERTRILADPGAFIRECEALAKREAPHYVVIDEAQNVPSIFDAVQFLYDREKMRWRFVLLGSSARKLRLTGANLLPGRALMHRLMPLVLAERNGKPEGECLTPMNLGNIKSPRFPDADLIDRLAYGELPGVALLPVEDRAAVLQSYATIYLEEEIRREGLVRNWGAFVNFLRLAATESGEELNYAAISRQVGISLPTVKSHYQLLEDMFLGIRVPGWSRSPRKSLISNPKLWKRLQYLGGRLHHVRTKDGREIDFLVEMNDELIPVEVKWTDRPTTSDARHISAFMKNNPKSREGYVICRCPRPQQLCQGVTALPWQNL